MLNYAKHDEIEVQNVIQILPSYSNGDSSDIKFLVAGHWVSARQRINWTPSLSSSHGVPLCLASLLIVLTLCCVPTSRDNPPSDMRCLIRESDDKLLGVREHVMLHCVQGPQLDHSQSSGNNVPKMKSILHLFYKSSNITLDLRWYLYL